MSEAAVAVKCCFDLYKGTFDSPVTDMHQMCSTFDARQTSIKSKVKSTVKPLFTCDAVSRNFVIPLISIKV